VKDDPFRGEGGCRGWGVMPHRESAHQSAAGTPPLKEPWSHQDLCWPFR
jgi:hypothetical protein